jgi:hypothetical protein
MSNLKNNFILWEIKFIKKIILKYKYYFLNKMKNLNNLADYLMGLSNFVNSFEKYGKT